MVPSRSHTVRTLFCVYTHNDFQDIGKYERARELGLRWIYYLLGTILSGPFFGRLIKRMLIILVSKGHMRKDTFNFLSSSKQKSCP